MFRGRRQLLWYMIGGFFLLLAGVVALAGITFPNSLPIMLVAAGVIIIALRMLGFIPTFPAFVVFLSGVVVFGLVASAPYGFTGFTSTETYELTTAQATVDEARLLCSVLTGDIKVSFTSNATLIYRIVFTKYFSIFSQPKVDFKYSVVNEELTVNASSTTATVDVTLNQNLKSSFTLTTTTGSIRVEAPSVAFKIEKITATATTGNVWVNMSSTAQLQSLVAKTTTGNVEAIIKSSFQTRDATVQLTTTTGRVKLNLNIANIESDIKASTTTGRINADNLIGFTILSSTQTSFHAQTSNYDTPPFKNLDISASTTTGNIDIVANHT